MQRLLAAVLLFLTLGAAGAQDNGTAAAAPRRTAEQSVASLGFQQGKVLPPSFRYLPPNDTARLLEQGWGNPLGPGRGRLRDIVVSGATIAIEQLR